jgi:hypothetical protein
MGSYTLGELMVNGTDVQVHGFATAKCPLYHGESFVGAHGILGRKLRDRYVGSDDVDPIESRFGSNAIQIASKGKGRLGNLDHEMFSHLEPIDDFPHSQGNLSLSLESVFPPSGGLNDRLQVSFGRLEEIFSLAGSLLLEQWIAASN